MMKKPFFFALCFLLSITVFGQQEASRLSLKPSAPVAGKTISLSYNAKGTDLEFSDEVKAVAMLFRDLKWVASPVTLTKGSEFWTGTLLLPADADFFTIRFFQGEESRPEAADNNEGRGFYSPVLNMKKKPATGYYLGELMLMMGNAELRLFASPQKDGERAAQLLKKATQLSATGLSEAQLAEVQRYYQFTLKDDLRAESLTAEIKSRFPKGTSARFISFQKALQEKDPAKYVVALETFLQDFPVAEWRKQPGTQSYIYYTVYRGLATAYFDNKAYDKFIALFQDFDFKTANEAYRWNLTKIDLMGKEEDKKAMLPLSQKIMPYLLKLKNDGSYQEDFGGNDSLENENMDKQIADRIATHVSFCKAAGAFREGADYFQYLPDHKRYDNADLNETHLFLLEQLGEKEKIKPLLEQAVKQNAVTPLMFDKLKAVYLAEHDGIAKGYEQYLASLKSSDAIGALREHVMANMVHHPLIPFSLENAEGKMVNSEDWKGKIVVIDFWATWCRPCIMAFPGMQLLIDKYAKDPTVGVYMIGTMQFGDYKEKSVNYVKSKGFRFNLLHDAIGDKGEQNKVFKSLIPLFNSSGIPRKIIIKTGEVRYSSEGYSGSPSQLMDELSMAIEILRNEK
ncbi:TlpA family protein disulfide reductase [Pedobacter sp. GR22-6]|uniref:TlpA family protein disulfide reductase n=1 Tax=Pedobacter sp. GR22-6 TaxID=3127957 RepID=UPI00307E2BF6